MLNLFKLYIRQRVKGILALLVFCVIFVVSFFLYRLPIEAVLYPTLLCVFLGIVFLVIDFGRVKKKHQLLCEIQNLTSAMMTSFPEVESVEDADYQEIIEALRCESAQQATDFEVQYRDMIEYYTIWAHQIKTPIASMKLSLQNEDTALSRKLSSDLFRIEQYVEMVLAYLRLDSTSGDYVFKEQELDGIIRQTVKKFASEFILRKIHLEYEPVKEKLITDEKWLCFVLEQLLSNALKYTREGGYIRICLSSDNTLCIADNGIGIAPEDLPRIFEKGYTGYNGRSDKRASGIGLYLCRRVCEKLGIRMSAESEPDKGTAIFINFEQYPLRVE